MILVQFGLLVLSLTAAAASPVVEVAQPATLDELRASPDVFDGHIVRLSGQMNMCWNTSCKICPLEATQQVPQADRCLSMEFDRFRGSEANRGANMDAAFRYADVILTAKFDPGCLKGVCLDRASVLLGARVEQVTRRRLSRDGLIGHPEMLSPAPEDVARVTAELVRFHRNEEYSAPVRVFAVQSDPAASRDAVVCKSSAPPDAPVIWPTSVEGAIFARSTEDSYWCWLATRDAGVWKLHPG